MLHMRGGTQALLVLPSGMLAWVGKNMPRLKAQELPCRTAIFADR
jgi:hypothetical protein